MSTVLSLQGKTAIVTGGAGGLGLAITDLFLEAGANVVAIDINTDLVQTFEASHDKSRAVAVEANVTLEDDLEDLFKTAIKKFGKVDIVVNNAGITDRLGKCAQLLLSNSAQSMSSIALSTQKTIAAQAPFFCARDVGWENIS